MISSFTFTVKITRGILWHASWHEIIARTERVDRTPNTIQGWGDFRGSGAARLPNQASLRSGGAEVGDLGRLIRDQGEINDSKSEMLGHLASACKALAARGKGPAGEGAGDSGTEAAGTEAQDSGRWAGAGA
eukprot:7378160-Prymnesium_polylepis.1